MATNRYVCEVCHKEFQRDQNLQLHRRRHSLPWKLKQRPNTQVKKRVYVCPKPNCVHHHPSLALGDLTGIKKHFCRKHGEKKWKCDKCSKRYAAQSDWKAHTKICGTSEYRCDCGTIFSRKDSFVTHRAFCDALAEENYRVNKNLTAGEGRFQSQEQQELFTSVVSSSNSCSNTNASVSISNENNENSLRPSSLSLAGIMNSSNLDSLFNQRMSREPYMAFGSPYSSATALLQKAAAMGAKISDNTIAPILLRDFTGYSSSSISSSVSAHEGSSTLGLNAVGANSFNAPFQTQQQTYTFQVLSPSWPFHPSACVLALWHTFPTCQHHQFASVFLQNLQQQQCTSSPSSCQSLFLVPLDSLYSQVKLNWPRKKMSPT
ncbi:hypothetical protein SLA2020_151550 [Shorea laevis]